MIKNFIIGSGFTASIAKILIGKNANLIGSLDHQFLIDKKYLRRKSIEANKLFSKKAQSHGSIKFKLPNAILHDRLSLGGNSVVWGGKINIKKIPKKIILLLKKRNLIFKKLSFQDTGTISSNKDIYQLQNQKNKIATTNDMINKIRPGYLESFFVYRKKIFINVRFSSKARKLQVKKLFLCIGSIQFLDLLYRSNFLKENDVIEFSEFRHEFVLKFCNPPFKKNITTMRYRFSRAIGHLFGIQYFSQFLKIFNFVPLFIDQNFYPKKIRYKLQMKNGELIEKNYNLTNYKFGKSIHYCNLKINGVDINTFLRKINKNIFGLGMSFINQKSPGPISNEIILDIKKKIKK